MKQLTLFLLSAMVLSSNTAFADVDCRFEGLLGKERVFCKARLGGNCNTLNDKVQGKGTSENNTVCSGFEVWCEGERITRGEQKCQGTQVQTNDGHGVFNAQFTDRIGEKCVYPAVKFSTAIPTKSEKAGARLYLSEKKVLFGKCDIGDINP